jgi:hypothetical protein
MLAARASLSTVKMISIAYLSQYAAGMKEARVSRLAVKGISRRQAGKRGD